MDLLTKSTSVSRGGAKPACSWLLSNSAGKHPSVKGHASATVSLTAMKQQWQGKTEDKSADATAWVLAN